MTNKVRGADLPVVVSVESLEDSDLRAPIDSNIAVVNALFGEYLTQSEISHDALMSYYVDYYLAQMNNGGFAQFVYNSAWNETLVAFIREGLLSMGAKQHSVLFEKGASLVAARKGKLASFFSSKFFGKNSERDKLNSINSEFYEVENLESLEKLNAMWLKSGKGLVTLPMGELRQEVSRQSSRISDRAARIAEARKAEPQYMKLIRALCDAAGHELDRITAGDPTHKHEGKAVLAWHFLTNKGHHLMVESSGKAIMFSGSSREKIAEVPVH